MLLHEPWEKNSAVDDEVKPAVHEMVLSVGVREGPELEKHSKDEKRKFSGKSEMMKKRRISAALMSSNTIYLLCARQYAVLKRFIEGLTTFGDDSYALLN